MSHLSVAGDVVRCLLCGIVEARRGVVAASAPPLRTFYHEMNFMIGGG